MSTGFGNTLATQTVDQFLTNPAGNVILARCTVANLPTGAGYAIGCSIQATDTGNNYVNTGTASAAVFTLLDAGTAFGLPTAATDATSTTGDSFLLTETTLTTGNGIRVLGTTGTFTTGGALVKADMSAAIAGNGFVGVTTGVYTGTGLLTLTAASATTGTIGAISAAGLTTGNLLKLTAAVATLTTGRFLSANDGATEVFGIGLNGHLISTASASAPSVASTVNQGISAVALTAGATDTCGTITTTGTQNNTGDSTFTVTFGKTYTTAPKCVILTPANAAAALAAQSGAYISSITATTFVVGVSKSSAAAATPSWNYFVIA